MVAITAALVKQLRDRTGQPMMDCKKALTDADGDMEKAVDLLRKKGMAVMTKRGDRETTQGRVIARVEPDGKTAALAILSCETDFTAKSAEFGAVAEAVVRAVAEAPTSPQDADELGQISSPDGKKLNDLVNEIVSQTGEKITLGRFVRFDLDGPGLLHCYVHFNHKVGTLVHFAYDSDPGAANDTLKNLAADLAMHITAVNPLTLSRDELPPEDVQREKEIAASQVQNKPANIVEKIVDGKMNKWFEQNVLLEQPFVKDDSKSVTQLIEEVSKQTQVQVRLKRFARLQIG